MNRFRLLASYLLLLAALGGCNTSAPASSLPTTTLRIGQVEYTLEIANTEPARQFGLMKRDSMPERHGMIFVFPDEEERRFWMKNTRIPLDILYVSASGTIVSIHTMQPFDLSGTPSNGPAKWAIELNAGQVKINGAKVGDTLTIPPTARDAAE